MKVTKDLKSLAYDKIVLLLNLFSFVIQSRHSLITDSSIYSFKKLLNLFSNTNEKNLIKSYAFLPIKWLVLLPKTRSAGDPKINLSNENIALE